MRPNGWLTLIGKVDLTRFDVEATDKDAMRRYLAEVGVMDGEAETVAALADRLQWPVARFREIETLAKKINLIRIDAPEGKPVRRWVRWDRLIECVDDA